MMLAAPQAHATFPGANGKFAYTCPSGIDICTMNPDGTGKTALTSFAAGTRVGWPAWSSSSTKIAFSLCQATCSSFNDMQVNVMNADGSGVVNTGVYGHRPAWSPDGTKLAFEDCCGSGVIYVMNVDGSGVTRISHAPGRAFYPDWSPGGTKIVYAAVDAGTLYIVNPDGSGETQLTTPGSESSPSDAFPSWSPDGARIVFSSRHDNPPGQLGFQLFTIKPDGTGLTRLTNDMDFSNHDARWSPDGAKIAFGHGAQFAQGDPSNGFYVMNADGTGRTLISTDGGIDSWQSIVNVYPRPKGATPMRAPLVPAFKPCSAPNSQHGAPLSYSSCGAPAQTSGYVTVGTPPQDPANSVGSVLIRAFSCPACVGPGPNADVRFDVSVTDVRNKSDLSDYTGELQVDAALRITDRNNTPNPGGPGAATVSDTHFPVTVPCATTSDTTVGSTCSVSSAANAVLPGSVSAGQRAIWELGQVQVYDGGADGVASTAADNTLFMDQGLFVP
jgi:hypothetical protein